MSYTVTIKEEISNIKSTKSEMIAELSGRSHTVYTGVCVRSATKEEAFYTESKVFFDDFFSNT